MWTAVRPYLEAAVRDRGDNDSLAASLRQELAASRRELSSLRDGMATAEGGPPGGGGGSAARLGRAVQVQVDPGLTAVDPTLAFTS